MLAALIGLALAHAQTPSCSEPADTQTLVTALGAADTAFGAMQIDAFVAAREEVLTLLPCLREPLTPADAAHVHRIEAYAAFLDRDPEASRRALMSMLRAAPEAGLPSAVAPEGHPLHALWQEARAEVPELEVLVHPADGALLVDGWRGAQAPVNEPTIVQHVSTGGAVKWTLLRQPGVPLPAYAPAPTPVGQPIPPVAQVDLSAQPAPLPAPPPRPVALAAGAAGSALLSGALLGTSLATWGRFNELTVSNKADAEDALRLQAATNRLILASGVAGGAALGLGAAAVVRW